MPLTKHAAKELSFVRSDGEEYTLPRIVAASESRTLQNEYQSFPSGGAALNAFQSNPSLLPVNTDVSSFPLKHSLPAEYQFSFFSYAADSYTASLRNHLDYIDNEFLHEKIAKLPQPFSAENPSAVAAYRAFFAEVGTHVIISTTFGGRCNVVSTSLWSCPFLS